MLRTALTDLLSLRAPIVGAPMAGVSGADLAVAVSAGGGLGMLGFASTASGDAVRTEASRARSGGHHFGIGLMAWALADHPDQFDAAIESGPALVSVSFGDASPWVERLRDAGVPVATQVADVREAKAAADCGVSVLVARGAEGGGHGRDAVGTLPLLQGVLDAVDVPVLAAGGIATARGLAAVLAAGAAGAWIGTALLACREAATPPAARARVLAADETDTVVTRVFDVAQGIPWPPAYGGRALGNAFERRWHGREELLAADEDAAAELGAARDRGDYEVAYVYAGQAVGLVDRERPASAVVAELAAGAEDLLRQWCG